ncbi:hypothetical protein OnM2_044078 [Erysiphe neolycopersici]|uniref:MARVEL domain-containing protein n=1 Tax=Erysiphe neolycopersici TaxID=212602 RepID=A0A420HUP1_9PEZI|nr:hypothetical protein OnM2_044078 [Erysiphe neolycopersici]
MILADILSIFLRLGELIFSIIVLALTAAWLRHHGSTSGSHPRFIYTIVIAAISILFSLIFVFPVWGTFVHWPIDLLLFVANMVAFGLLVHFIRYSCGNVWDLNGGLHRTECGRYKSVISFLFLASIFFLASALLGLYVMRNRTKKTTVDNQVGNGRKRWYSGRR